LDPKRCTKGEEVYMGEGLDANAQHGFYYLETSSDGYVAAMDKYKKSPAPAPPPGDDSDNDNDNAPKEELESLGKKKRCPGTPEGGEGGWDGFGKELTEEECKDKCLADADCVAVLWNKKGGACGGWKTCSEVVGTPKEEVEWKKRFLFKKV
jgi:hypothetical protein